MIFSFFIFSLGIGLATRAQSPAGQAPGASIPPPEPMAELPPPPPTVAPSAQGQVPLPPVPPAPAPNLQPPTAQPAAPEVSATAENANEEMPKFQNPEGYNYDPTGRRDPFKPYGESQAVTAPDLRPQDQNQQTPPEPLQAFDVSQFKLLGILWQVRDPKAMVADPSGRTFLIRKQTKIGRNNGFVAAIREGEVIVVEPSVTENGVQTAVTRVMNLK